MKDCPHCEYHKNRAARWRAEAYKQAGHDVIELPWVGLTEGEFKQIMLDTYNIDLDVPGHLSDDHLLWRAIEAKLRSKNACEENATDPSKEDWDSACNNLAEARTIPNPEFDKAHDKHRMNTA